MARFTSVQRPREQWMRVSDVVARWQVPAAHLANGNIATPATPEAANITPASTPKYLDPRLSARYANKNVYRNVRNKA